MAMDLEKAGRKLEDLGAALTEVTDVLELNEIQAALKFYWEAQQQILNELEEWVKEQLEALEPDYDRPTYGKIYESFLAEIVKRKEE